MHDFSTRVLAQELLDGNQVAEEEVRKSLLDLRRINQMFGAKRVLLSALAKELSRRQATDFSVLDIASGSCDLPIAVIRWASSRGMRSRVFALEYRHRHLRLFRNELAAHSQLHPFCADALQAPVPDGSFDFVTCGHFLHHLTEEQAATLLSSMANWARYAVIVSDLERHPVSYYFFRTFQRFLTTSRVSRLDGLTSLAQSFQKPELEKIAQRAGLAGCTVERRWPFHLLLVADGGGTARQGSS